MSPFDRDPIVDQIIGAAIEVHRVLGPGLLESTYEGCLTYELLQRGLDVARQVPLSVNYKNIKIDCGYQLDLLVCGDVLVEVKSVDRLAPIHTAQILTYLQLSGARYALLFNFNELTLKQGLRCFIGRGKQVPEVADVTGMNGN